MKSFTPSAKTTFFHFMLFSSAYTAGISGATLSQLPFWSLKHICILRNNVLKKQIIFHSVSTMLSITSPSKAGALLKPHRCPASHSHQELCICSYSIHHIPAKRRHVDAGLGKSCSQCQCPGRPDGQLQIYPKPFFTAMSVSLCCLGRSWNRHHTSWMQISHLIWHFQ